MSNDAIKARLRKLLALAERGEGGEKDNARRMLEKMLDRHGMTMADLEDEARQWHTVKYSGEFERRLMLQIMAKVQNTSSPEMFRRKGLRGARAIMVTPAELIEFEIHWEALRKGLDDCMQMAFSAFVQTNQLFPSDSGTDGKELTPAELEKIKAMAAMMQGLTPVPVHHRLEHGQ